jgi:hypothetical protein
MNLHDVKSRALRSKVGPTLAPNSREERGQRAKYSETGLVPFSMNTLFYPASFEVSAACQVHVQAAVPAGM